MYKGVCVCVCGGGGGRFADFIHFFLKYPMRPNYFIFIGYLQMGGGGGGGQGGG